MGPSTKSALTVAMLPCHVEAWRKRPEHECTQEWDTRM